MSVSPSVPRSTPPEPTLAAPFSCTWSSGANAAWVHVAGELDLASSPRLERTLKEAQKNTRLVVLDPRGLTFIDCAGIHTILESAARARSEGGWLMLMVASPLVERLLTLTGGHDLVTIFDVDLEPDPRESAADKRAPRRWRPGSVRAVAKTGVADSTPELERHGRLRAVRDNAEDAPLPSGVRAAAWSRPTPGRDHAIKRVAPG
jgi:anti-anti-sigma factor